MADNTAGLITARGLFWSTSSAFLWATTFVTGRHLLKNNAVDPLTLSALRFVIGALALCLAGLWLYGRGLFRLNLSLAPRFALLGLLGIAGMSVLLFYGQQHTTAINSSVIMQMNPLMILFMGPFIGERLGRWQITGAALCLLGCLAALNVITPAGFSYSEGHLRGDLLVLLSAFCWALYSLLGKGLVSQLGGFAVTMWAMLAGAAELLLLRCVFPEAPTLPAEPVSWGLILYLAVFPTAVAFFAWYEAMSCLDLAILNVMQYLTPVFTIVLAWLFLRETMVWLNAAGVALVIGGILLTGLRPPAPAPEKSGA